MMSYLDCQLDKHEKDLAKQTTMYVCEGVSRKD
jgi:hypothetical protein